MDQSSVAGQCAPTSSSDRSLVGSPSFPPMAVMPMTETFVRNIDQFVYDEGVDLEQWA
jgi:hypothetical protein